MTSLNPISAHLHGFTEARMTDAEAKHEAEEAADKLAVTLAAIRVHLDGIDQAPFGDVSKRLDAMMRLLNRADGFGAEVKSALSKIKVRETVDAG